MNREKIEEKFPVDPLIMLYHRVKEERLSDTEIMNKDITNEFWASMRARIKNKQLITISTRGETRSGKSTVALAIKHEVNKIIEQNGLNNNIDEYKTLCSDQIEFNRAIMKGFENVCFSIDEWSALGETDGNATVEKSLFEFYTDVCAARYIHRVSCTPRSFNGFDSNSVFLLDVIASDKPNKLTLCRVYYNDPTSAIQGGVALGVVKISVKDILDKEWFKRYEKKKMARIELLDKHGVKDVRELEFAKLQLQVYDELKDMAYSNETIPNGIISSTVRSILQKNKLMFSMLGRGNLNEYVKGLFELDKTIYKYDDKLMKPMEEEKQKNILKLLEVAKKQKNENLDYLNNNIKVLEEYNNIE